ncbi:hypothetical protein GCM10028803_20420 [Larkinella knui]|uniref:Uncharacterized protein n=1 Tax=Larkinella knui TaxID=2025310 RepID=A0A3P1CUV1_9BACT|nr:hypothetical protein [Larkinella knui]RRB17127.1 hypothetical protein EHT87_02275 [Larkinella knui]
MKTSNKLLIAFFTIGLLTLIGANVALRKEYDKINFSDPFYGLTSVSIKPFRVLKLEGNSAGLVSVQTGKVSEIRLPDKDRDLFSYRLNGDTLVFSYKPKSVPWQSKANQYFDAAPAAVILTPKLETLLTTRVSCNLNQLTADQLQIVQDNSGILLTNSSIGKLTVLDQKGSELHTKPTNRVGNATVVSRDSSVFMVERDIFGSLTLETDSLGKVTIPGGLLKKLKP